jgi:hypothetical protein
MTRTRRRRGPVSRKQRAWIDSARMQDVRRAAALKSAAARVDIQKCDAKTRGGGRCQNPGTGRGGRCRFHSGSVGAGAAWHVVILPADPVKRARKLRDVARRRAKQAACVAAMSDEERSLYMRRSRAAQPGSPAARAQRRQDRAAAKIFAQLSTHKPEASAEIAELDRRIAELDSRIAASKQRTE